MIGFHYIIDQELTPSSHHFFTLSAKIKKKNLRIQILCQKSDLQLLQARILHFFNKVKVVLSCKCLTPDFGFLKALKNHGSKSKNY